MNRLPEIRLGNDVRLCWRLSMPDATPLSLAERIEVWLITPFNRMPVADFVLNEEAAEISFSLPASKQEYSGVYGSEIRLTFRSGAVATVDNPAAFRLAAHSPGCTAPADVAGNGCGCAGTLTVVPTVVMQGEFTMQGARGEALKFSDLTAAQIAELQRPATEMVAQMQTGVDELTALTSEWTAGKAAVAAALRGQGIETADDAPLGEMAASIGRELVRREDFVFTAAERWMAEHAREDMPYMYIAIWDAKYGREARLTGADAYLCSDGHTAETDGVHEVQGDGAYLWVIFYHRTEEFAVCPPMELIDRLAVMNGKPDYSGIAAVRIRELIDYTIVPDGTAQSAEGFANVGRLVLAGWRDTTALRNFSTDAPEVEFAGIENISLNKESNYAISPLYKCANLRKASFSDLRELLHGGGTSANSSESIAYECSLLETVELPELVFTNIYSNQNGTFYNCDSLKRISLPKLRAVTATYSDLVNNCNALEEAALPELKKIVSVGTAGLFNLCGGLKKISLPNYMSGLIAIGCRNLEEVYLEGVTSVVSSMFSNSCDSLRVLSMPNLYEITGGVLLKNAYKIERISFPHLRQTNGSLMDVAPALSEVDLPELRTVSGSIFLFHQCDSLVEVILPKAETLSPQNAPAFYKCGNLEDVYLPELHTSTRITDCARRVHLGAPAGTTTIVVTPNGYQNTRTEAVTVELGFAVNLNVAYVPGLTAESLRALIANLGEVTTTRTLTLGATNKAKLTEEEIAAAVAKGWTVA